MKLFKKGSGIQNGRFFIQQYLGSNHIWDFYKALEMAKITPMRVVLLKIARQRIAGEGLCNTRIIEYSSHEEAESRVKIKYSHPYDVGRLQDAEESDFCIGEFVHGRTLRSIYLQQQFITPVYFLLADITRILKVCMYLHEQNPPVLLEDITLDSILIHKQTLIITNYYASAGRYTSRSEGKILNPYMAPELRSNHTFSTISSDIYSLGIILYELLTGKHPLYDIILSVKPSGTGKEVYSHWLIDETTRNEWNIRLLFGKGIVPPSFANPDLSSLWDPVILKCLQNRHEDRYNRIGSLYHDFSELIENLSFQSPYPDITGVKPC